MALAFLCSPAPSVPYERIFSNAGGVLSKKRNFLNHNTLFFVYGHHQFAQVIGSELINLFITSLCSKLGVTSEQCWMKHRLSGSESLILPSLTDLLAVSREHWTVSWFRHFRNLFRLTSRSDPANPPFSLWRHHTFCTWYW